jgi:thioredoxin
LTGAVKTAPVFCDHITEQQAPSGYTKENKRKGAMHMAAMNINAKQYEELILGSKPVLVDFWAPWCTYCRRIDPVISKLADSREDVLIVKVNIDDEPELASQERIEVIPTLVVYKEGFEMGSIVAPESKARIEEFLAEAL